MVEPGPDFSVADVHRGWRRGFERQGHAVINYNLGERLDFYRSAHVPTGPEEFAKAFEGDQPIKLALFGVESAALRWWPDVVVFTSGFYIPSDTIHLLQSRGMKVVILHTESPYEDVKQLQGAAYADLNLINDPTNLESFRMVAPNSHYLPHAYDPTVHTPGPSVAEYKSDVCFVGTGFPSRAEFLETVDWSGLDVLLAGSWHALDDDSPLLPYLAHERDECLPNDQAVEVYRSSKMSLNLYRREASDPAFGDGWSVGPREVELAACGTFFARDPRPEGDELFSMLPTFTDPGELGELCRWWSSHDDQRESAAADAREVVAGWTFDARVEQMLGLLGV